MEIHLANQLQNYEKYLQYRFENPHELRIEVVFSFTTWDEFVNISWPLATPPTHCSTVEILLDAIDMLPKDKFKQQLGKCLQ